VLAALIAPIDAKEKASGKYIPCHSAPTFDEH